MVDDMKMETKKILTGIPEKAGSRILILSGGSIHEKFAAQFLKGEGFDRVIAADAGLASCKKLGICPTDILGDFDSLQEPELLKEYREKGVPIRQFPARKDYTDTHLAVMYAMDLSPSEVVILGATGTRYDHTLANIGLLERLTDAGISCQIIDAHNRIEMLSGKTEKQYKKPEGKTFFSLMPWSGDVTGIDLIGFSYPLCKATLHTCDSLGISNEIVEKTATLRMETGHLLVIQSRD